MSLATGNAEFFVLRTPLLPVETLLDWSGGLAARGSYERGEPLGPSLAADRALLRQRLAQLIARPEVREAIFVASPSLDDAIEHWLREPEGDKGQRAERALVRYLCRMAARPTPFGLFAGISTGTVGKETRLSIGGREACRRHTRLDNDYLFALVQALAKDPALRDTLRYHPNDSCCTGAGRVRYVEARVKGTPPRRSYHLVSAENSPELQATLSRAGSGATRAELAQALVCDEVGSAEALAFVDELIASQVLVPDLALPVTGAEPLPTLVRELGERATLESTAGVLQRAGETLAALDQTGLGNQPGRYRELAKTFEPLPAKVELATLFQVDLVKPASGLSIGESVLREIDRGVEILHRMGGVGRRDPLARFRDAFQERYEEREVPLLEALDEEVGLGGLVASAGDASPLLKGVEFPEPPDDQRPWGNREKHLLTLLGAALQDGREEIALESKDLERLAIPSPGPLPHAFEVFATVLAPSAAAIERGDFRLWLNNASGPPGARFLGRFCHTDPALAHRVENLLRAEERHDPNAIYAEMVHLPEGRLGNILLRPQLRSHEITWLGRSGAARERQIPANDLQLSLQDGRFVLRSARLDRRIIPRLTTAHSFSIGLGVYRFLCLLQLEGVAHALGWDWGPLASAPFLPRVRVGRIMLSPMHWNLITEECKQLGAAVGEERFRRIQEWRRQRRLPRWVALADHDNRLPVDLDNALSVDAFVHEIKGRESARLEGISLGPDELCVEGPDGHYTHEIVVPFVRPADASASVRQVARSTKAAPSLPAPLPLGPSAPRQFPPGSEWLYAKLYTSLATADEVLTEVIGPLTHQLIESGAVTGWFFIRYSDPEHHLRWRLTGDPEVLERKARPAIEAAASKLLDDGRVWKVQFDTYQREVERYSGPEGIALAERLFQADSEAVLEIVELLDPGDAGLDERWRLALRGMDQLLSDLGLDLAARRDYSERWIERALKDPTRGRILRPQLTERYRRERARLEPLFDRNQDHDSDLAPGLAAYRQRSERLTPIVAELKRLEREGRLPVPIAELARSYVHMHVNRLLRSEQNQHELILHDFLHRLYEAQAARATAREPITEPMP
jgi:thiopeptide-type bacteriocin biosynthesis protein